MKKLIPFNLIPLLIFLTTCNIILKDDDPCDKTAFDISQNLNLRVNINCISDVIDFSTEPQGIRVEFHKIACGFDEYKAGGDITYTGTIDSEGFYISGDASYNIRNTNDRIIIIVFRKIDDVWKQVNYEELTFIKEDFTSGALSPRLTRFYTFRI